MCIHHLPLLSHNPYIPRMDSICMLKSQISYPKVTCHTIHKNTWNAISLPSSWFNFLNWNYTLYHLPNNSYLLCLFYFHPSKQTPHAFLAFFHMAKGWCSLGNKQSFQHLFYLSWFHFHVTSLQHVSKAFKLENDNGTIWYGSFIIEHKHKIVRDNITFLITSLKALW